VNTRVLHTIGHSTRPLETFLEMLRRHDITLLVDVRRWPASRRHPHFAREPLSRALVAAGVDYLWMEELGGYRKPRPDSPNTGWRVAAFRAYADFMLTPEFDRIVDRLEPRLTAARATLMCAEAVPWQCHRQLLADAFTVRGWNVQHILDRSVEPHRLPPFARPDGTRVLYPSTDRPEPPPLPKGLRPDHK
jgi:uncharacterized protein (DUF488 family)